MSHLLSSHDDGFSAIWVAILMIFLIGSTALAVDVSGFYQEARAEQTDADLTCLAGVRELPENPAAALTHAAEFAQRNWPELASVSPVIAGSEAVLDDGNGNLVRITTPVDGESTKMKVEIGQLAETAFAKVLGAQNVRIGQVAYCKTFGLGAGVLPFGALPGGWDGGLQDPNPCGENSGNCGRLFIKRLDGTSGSGPTAIANIGFGSDRDLVPSWGAPPPPSAHCTTSTDVDCSVIETDTGVNAAALGAGFILRLRNTAGADTTFVYGGNTLNGDTIQQVLGVPIAADITQNDPTNYLVPLSIYGQPSDWMDGLHGRFATVDISNHYYFNGIVAKCESPRLAGNPIVAGGYPDEQHDDLTYDPAAWTPSDPFPQWPNGAKDMKVVGSYFLYIDDPNGPEDFQGSGQLKRASSKIIWLGPDAECVGPNAPVKPWEAGDAKVSRLVDENG